MDNLAWERAQKNNGSRFIISSAPSKCIIKFLFCSTVSHSNIIIYIY